MSALASLTIANDAQITTCPSKAPPRPRNSSSGPTSSTAPRAAPPASRTAIKPTAKDGGPGYLYAAINQRGFGANPSVPGAGGPSAACGIYYELTSISAHGVALAVQSLTLMTVDECPADPLRQQRVHAGFR